MTLGHFYHPVFLLIIILLLFSILILILLYAKASYHFCLILILVGFFLLGLFSSSIESYPSHENHLKNLVKEQPELFQNNGVEILGAVTAPIETSSRGNTLLISHVVMKFQDRQIQTKGKIKLFIPHPSHGERIFFRPGDRIEAYAKMKIPRSFANPGAFDYISYLESDGIYLVGYIKSTKLLSLKKNRNWKWNAIMAEWRQKIAFQVQNMCRLKEEYREMGSFILAITIGNREDFKKETKRLLIRGGLYHIVAISGLHVGFIAFLIFRFLSFFKCPDRWSSLLTALILLTYLPLTGGRGSALRATTMAVFYLIGRTIHRKSHILTSIFLSAFLLLLKKPSFLYDPGFQLTYAATFSIVLFYPLLLKMISWSNIFCSSIFLTVSAQIGVFPILAYHFNTVVWISLLTNILIIPLMVIIIPFSFGLELSLFINDSFSYLFAFPLMILIKSIFSVATIYNSMPFLSYRIPAPPIFIIVMYYFFTWGLHTLRTKYLKASFFILFLSSLILISIHPFSPKIKELSEITFIDVGQGESALITSPDGYCMLIDGGGRWGDRFDAGEMVISKFLWHKKLKKIDCVILSHLHADHAGGVPSLIENFRIKEIIISEVEKQEKLFSEIKNICLKRGTKIHLIREDLIQHHDHFTLELFHIDLEKGQPMKENERSLIAKITCGKVRFLFTGDAPSSIEMAILESRRDINSEILKIGHHGSNDATTQSFLEAVDPAVCIVSCGAYNRWGHPMPQVLERIDQIGARLYRTDKDGAVTILTNGSSYCVESFIERSPLAQ